jgi:hypothetical protein
MEEETWNHRYDGSTFDCQSEYLNGENGESFAHLL